MRYYMAIDSNPLASLPLALFGVGSESAYVDLLQDKLMVRVGNLFNETFSLSELGRGERFSWPWFYGLGVRTDFQGLVGAVTSTQGVVAIRCCRKRPSSSLCWGCWGCKYPAKSWSSASRIRIPFWPISTRGAPR